MTDLYVYYRVPRANAARLEGKVRAMQSALAAGALKRRPEEQDGVQTWMEVYTDCPDGFAARLEQAAGSAGLAALIDGERHAEVFMDLSECA